MEERKQSEKAIEEAVKRTREELMEYIKEQKRVSYQRLRGFISRSEKSWNLSRNAQKNRIGSNVFWFVTFFFFKNFF